KFFGDVAEFDDIPSFTNSAGATIATGIYDKGAHKFVYTFTDYVENSINIRGAGKFTFWVDRYNVTMPGEQTFEVKVADKTVSTTLNVDFKISPQLVDSFIVE